MKKYLSTVLALILSLSLTACGSATKGEKEYPTEVCGEKIESQPISVVSLSPSLTEICYDLGFETTLDGVSDFCTLKDDKDALRLGTPQNPDIDGIISLKPDVVILNQPLLSSDYKKLLQADIKTVVFKTPTAENELWELYDQMGTLFSGKVTGEERAREKYNPYKEKLSNIKPIFDGKIVAFVPEKGIILTKDDGLIGIFLKTLGLELAKDEKALSSADLIIAGKNENLDTIFQKEELKASPAVKNKAGLKIDTDVLLRGGFDAISLLDDFANENAQTETTKENAEDTAKETETKK